MSGYGVGLERRHSSRATKGLLVGFLVGLLAAMLSLATLVSPAHAIVDDASPIPAAPPGPDTAVQMTGTGAGATINGFYPSAGGQDPTVPYPATDPTGYETLSGFAGIITAASVSDPSAASQFYCINLQVSTQVGVGYVNGSWDESNVPNLGYVAYILTSYYPTTALPAGLSVDSQAAAVQAAIWYFSDGFVVSSSDPAMADIRAAAATIVAAAQASGPQPEPGPPAVAVTPPNLAAPAGSPAGPFVVTAQDGAELTVTVPDGYTMFSDAAGTVPIANGATVDSGTSIWVRSPAAAADETVLRARAVVPVQRGNVYLYDQANPSLSDAQRLILAVTSELDALAQATAEFFTVGDLEVTKSFVGDAVGAQGAGELLVDCGGIYVFSTPIPAGITEAQTLVFPGIPTGSTCTITEPATGATAAVEVTSDTPQEVVVPNETGATAAVTNTVSYRPGGLSVTKAITGPAAGLQDSIVLTVVCGDVLRDTVVIPAQSPAGSYSRSYAELPAGTECVVTETASGVTTDVLVTAKAPVTVAIQPGAVSEVVFTNTVSQRSAIASRAELAATGASPAMSLPLLLLGGGGALAAGAGLLIGAARRTGVSPRS